VPNAEHDTIPAAKSQAGIASGAQAQAVPAAFAYRPPGRVRMPVLRRLRLLSRCQGPSLFVLRSV